MVELLGFAAFKTMQRPPPQGARGGSPRTCRNLPGISDLSGSGTVEKSCTIFMEMTRKKKRQKKNTYRKSQNVKRLKEIGEGLDLFTHFMMIQRGGINEITIYYFRKLTSVKSTFAKIHLNEINVFEIPPR